jgi:hypothetical protein
MDIPGWWDNRHVLPLLTGFRQTWDTRRLDWHMILYCLHLAVWCGRQSPCLCSEDDPKVQVGKYWWALWIHLSRHLVSRACVECLECIIPLSSHVTFPPSALSQKENQARCPLDVWQCCWYKGFLWHVMVSDLRSGRMRMNDPRWLYELGEQI